MSLILTAEGGKIVSSEWKKVHVRDDIVVSERWVTCSDGSKTRERKGEFSVQADADILLSLLKNPNKASKWMKAVSEHKIIGTRSQDEWFSYTVYDIPWPFKSQDMVSLYQIKNFPESGVYRLKISSVDEDLMEEIDDGFSRETDLKRLSQYKAEWIIEHKGTKVCDVRFTASSSTRPPFPRWMMDPVLIRLFEDNLMCFRDMALKEKGEE